MYSDYVRVKGSQAVSHKASSLSRDAQIELELDALHRVFQT